MAKRVHRVRIRIRRGVASWFVMISRTALCTAVDAPFTAFVVVFACSTKRLVSMGAAGVRTAGA